MPAAGSNGTSLTEGSTYSQLLDTAFYGSTPPSTWSLAVVVPITAAVVAAAAAGFAVLRQHPLVSVGVGASWVGAAASLALIGSTASWNGIFAVKLGAYMTAGAFVAAAVLAHRASAAVGRISTPRGDTRGAAYRIGRMIGGLKGRR